MYLNMQVKRLLRATFGACRHMQSYANSYVPDKVNITNSNKASLPLNYIRAAGSNQVLVTQLPDACNFWLRADADKLEGIREVLNYVLQAVILYDDVQDGTQYRRHLPAANRVYGAPLAMTSAMYCILQGFKSAMNLQNTMALSAYVDNFLTMMDGTAQDLYWRDNHVCPTEEEYKAMMVAKISSYFVMTFGLLQSFSPDHRDYQELAETLGLYYAMRDEYTNLIKVAALEEKSQHEKFKDLHNLMFCEDITEGRFSWPVIHGLRSSEGPTIRSILVQRTADDRIKQHCLDLLGKAGSLEYTRQTLLQLDTDLRDQIHNFGGNPKLEALLDELYNWNN